MAKEKDDDAMTNIRLPREWLARADALVDVLDQNEELRAFGRASRSVVLRLAVIEGLKVLETKHAAPEKSAKPKR